MLQLLNSEAYCFQNHTQEGIPLPEFPCLTQVHRLTA